MAETPTHAGPSFLGQLLARALPGRAEASAVGVAASGPAATPLPTLERRRPSLFEPRIGTPTTRPDIEVSSDESDAMSSRSMASSVAMVPTLPPGHASSAVASMTSIARDTTIAPSPRITTPDSTPVMTRTIERDATASASVTPHTRDDDTPSRPARLRADVAAPEMRTTRPDTRATAPVRDTDDVAPARAREVSAHGNLPVAPPRVVVERTRIETHTRVHERTSPAAAPAPRAQARESALASAPLRALPRVVPAQAPTRAVAHPSRSALHAPAPHSAAPAPVQVSIGRIEIRAATTAGTPTTGTRRQTNAPRLGLDDYLRQRHGSGR